MKPITRYAIVCFCGLSLVIILTSILLSLFSPQTHFGITPEAVGGVPELQNLKQNK